MENEDYYTVYDEVYDIATARFTYAEIVRKLEEMFVIVRRIEHEDNSVNLVDENK